MVKRLIVSLGLILVLVSCAAMSYKYYGLSGVTYENGVLLGPKPKDDLPFSMCAPTASVKNPCVVMFAKDFFAFKQDYLDMRERLKACEGK